LARHRNGNNIFLERLAKPNAGVESTLDDVRQARFDEHFDDDLGIALDEPRKGRGDHHSRSGSGSSDTDRSRGPAEKPPQIVDRAGYLLNRRAKPREQSLAGLRGRDTSCVASKELDVQALLEAPHRMAEC
jgi:hypothetical protein